MASVEAGGGCECECRCEDTGRLVPLLAGAVAVLALSSLSMLLLAIHFYKRSLSLPPPAPGPGYLAENNREISLKQHKINSFTCLELRDIREGYLINRFSRAKAIRCLLILETHSSLSQSNQYIFKNICFLLFFQIFIQYVA